MSTLLAPNFLVKFMANFNAEMKGMLPFVGNTIEADIASTMKTFNWTPIAFEKTVLDTAKSVEEIVNGRSSHSSGGCALDCTGNKKPLICIRGFLVARPAKVDLTGFVFILQRLVQRRFSS